MFKPRVVTVTKMKDFDYDGDINESFYNDFYDKAHKISLEGLNGLYQLNAELNTMNFKYKNYDKYHNEDYAKCIRAMYQIVTEFVER